MENIPLGNPINTTIVAQSVDFDWSDYDNVIVYLIGKFKTLKMSVVAKTGYLPLTIQSASTLLIEIKGKDAKTLGLGEVLVNIWIDSADVQSEIVATTPFGINYTNNQIQSEIV
jgi:hypothetical protein